MSSRLPEPSYFDFERYRPCCEVRRIGTAPKIRAATGGDWQFAAAGGESPSSAADGIQPDVQPGLDLRGKPLSAPVLAGAVDSRRKPVAAGQFGAIAAARPMALERANV
jgi:hypothetical protein